MPSTTSSSLPVLFVTDVVVLPGMVVPIELDESSQAADRRGPLPARRPAAGRPPARGPLRVVRRDRDRRAGRPVQRRSPRRRPQGRAARPDRQRRDRTRCRALGRGRAGRGRAVSDRARELAEEYKHLVVAVLQRREAWQVIDTVHRITDPSAIADTAGYAPYLSDERKRELLETPDVDERLEPLIAWTREHLAELEVTDKIREDVREGMEKSQREFLLRQQLAAIRKELGEGEPDGADDYRARVEAADAARRRPRGRAARGRQARARQRPEPGVRLDPHLAGHRPRAAVERHAPRTATDVAAARAVLDADHHGLDEVKDRIVEYLAVRARRAERGLQVVGGRGSGAVLAAGRPARGRQDLAGRERRPGPRPQVRPGRPRRRARRGRDPWPPPYLRRRAARPDRPGDQGGRLDEPGRAARRGRQGRRGLPRRPGGRPARGARPGAEPHVPRPLPRARPRPVRRAVHRDRQRGRARSRRRCWTGWSWSPSTATPRTTRSPSPATSCCPGSWSGRR